MHLIDDKDTIRAMKSAASPTRRKPVTKKTVEEEAADIIIAELKEVFLKDVRSRIVNPLLFDLLDPSHYKDIQPKQETPQKVETIKVFRPDPKIVVTPIEDAVASKPSPLKPEIMVAIERVTSQMWPGIPVIPVMSTGATDGLYLRNAGIPTYGHSGLASDIFDVRAHGRDERVLVKSFYEGQDYLYRLVKALAGGK